METFRMKDCPVVSLNWMGIKKFPGLTGVPAITKEAVPDVEVKPSGKAALTCHVPPNPAEPDKVEELIVPDPATPTWNSRMGCRRNVGVTWRLLVTALSRARLIT
jgi:hypothetical protein